MASSVTPPPSGGGRPHHASPASFPAAAAASSASALYGLAGGIPLIKSPALRIPPRPQLPVAQLHPLPPALEAYFVYDFHLEDYVLRQPRAALASARHAAEVYLAQRQKAKKMREEEQLRMIAPGWRPDAPALIPQRSETRTITHASGGGVGASGGGEQQGHVDACADPGGSSRTDASEAQKQNDLMAEMLDRLEAMDAAGSASKLM
ncbi:hypothetical protein K437DRAFT_225787 [Tilletiaria anomala UBC 951]|uniref:Uncharacterized protein n=1 Tax=Tilletiaria anomala (strain ATCC 24038 / CBS 436.72 / UBC 951) TaxID=1037660 RepID=A0A066VXC7_TILAU|nr:uncharacterized protein K437DRAFT_225787 [Tilletiaria anomala UBC 951]KDN43205.1 hypothetical protein K437DRAFT_225787 [Tilletiaria anomala UBC 951]